MRWLLPLTLALCVGCGEKEDDTAEPDGDDDGFGISADCDDSDPEVNPGAAERCDGQDNDCDGEIDEEGADGSTTYYADVDGDGYGDDANTILICDMPEGYVGAGYDCDDGDAATHPSAPETCDEKDNDCDGETDEDATDAPQWYTDADGDGWGDDREAQEACDQPTGTAAQPGDCDDARDTIHPEADERCNGVDDDCDHVTDEAEAVDAATWYRDYDGDGWGDPTRAETACDQPSGYVAEGSDCDDASNRVHPGAQESCNDVDDDCDGDLDDDAVDATTWYQDADGDGYGAAGSVVVACDQPTGMVADGTDCDDADADLHPRATELCDGIDNDCDGGVDGTGLVTLDGARNYATIGQAVRGASSGSTVTVCDGTYVENVEIDHDLTLVSLNGAGATTIDADDSGAALHVSAGAVLVQGFTLTGGSGEPHPENPSSAVGGGLLVMGADPVIVEDCTFYDNAADYGGGLFVDEGGAVEVSGAWFELNDATYSGGALYTWSATVSLTDSIVVDNAATWGGGQYADGGTLTFDAATFEANYADYGGAAFLGEDTLAEASDDTLLTDNTGTEQGGGLYLEQIAGWTGGVLEANLAEYGGGFFSTTDGTVDILIDDLTCSGNRSATLGGCGYLIGDATLTAVAIDDNDAAWGAGLFADESTTYLVNGSVTGNTASFLGGGAYVSDGSTLLSIGSDWGTGSTDNDPDDVYVGSGDVAYTAYGASSTFTCSDTAGICF